MVSPLSRALLRAYRLCKKEHGSFAARSLTANAVAVLRRFERTPTAPQR